MSSRPATISLLAAAVASHLVPSVATVAPVRNQLARRPAAGQVSLTFDDGPDPESTPQVLAVLAELGVQATFFVLGERLVRNPEVGRRIAAGEHELAVHGWTHRPHLLRSPLAIQRELQRTVLAIEATTGRAARFWRPPHGIVTGGGLGAGRLLGLRLALWTADGLDWRRAATAASIRDRLIARVEPGAVLLLHDSSSFGTPGSWRRVLRALPDVVEHCRARGWPLGPLGAATRTGPPGARTSGGQPPARRGPPRASPG
ncbi:MAG TPA: polysaccharide deacetylase family protein [Jatrophihabitans sp.]|nr:polysaccharide deacetylase family protein [Jatrophihabitans sp.]